MIVADRAARDAWLAEFAPDSKVDRAAWAVMSQHVPASGFSWWRAGGLLTLAAVLALGLSAAFSRGIGGPLGIGLAYTSYLYRARRAWDRYATRTQPPPSA